jgi:hypothetical protein
MTGFLSKRLGRTLHYLPSIINHDWHSVHTTYVMNCTSLRHLKESRLSNLNRPKQAYTSPALSGESPHKVSRSFLHAWNSARSSWNQGLINKWNIDLLYQINNFCRTGWSVERKFRTRSGSVTFDNHFVGIKMVLLRISSQTVVHASYCSQLSPTLITIIFTFAPSALDNKEPYSHTFQLYLRVVTWY